MTDQDKLFMELIRALQLEEDLKTEDECLESMDNRKHHKVEKINVCEKKPKDNNEIRIVVDLNVHLV